MKKGIKHLAVVLVASVASASAAIVPDWAGDSNTVHAEWDDMSMFDLNGGRVDAEVFTIVDGNGSVTTDIPGQGDIADLVSDSYSTGAYTNFYADPDSNYLEITADWDVSIWTPSFSGEETQEVWVQLTYFGDTEFRQGWDVSATPYLEGGSNMIVGGVQHMGEEYDPLTTLVTEAYSFVIEGSGDGVFIDLAGDPALTVGNPAFLAGVEVDSISYGY